MVWGQSQSKRSQRRSASQFVTSGFVLELFVVVYCILIWKYVSLPLQIEGKHSWTTRIQDECVHHVPRTMHVKSALTWTQRQKQCRKVRQMATNLHWKYKQRKSCLKFMRFQMFRKTSSKIKTRKRMRSFYLRWFWLVSDGLWVWKFSFQVWNEKARLGSTTRLGQQR